MFTSQNPMCSILLFTCSVVVFYHLEGCRGETDRRLNNHLNPELHILSIGLRGSAHVAADSTHAVSIYGKRGLSRLRGSLFIHCTYSYITAGQRGIPCWLTVSHTLADKHLLHQYLERKGQRVITLGERPWK